MSSSSDRQKWSCTSYSYLLRSLAVGSFVITSALHRSYYHGRMPGGLYVAGWLSRYAHPRGSADKILAIF
eukprot:scaffold56209_cov65-Cyclotella_meneghiniana.AAC.8